MPKNIRTLLYPVPLFVPAGGRGAEAGRPGEGPGVPLVPGGGAPGGGQGEEGGLHWERERPGQQATRPGVPHRQPPGRPVKAPHVARNMPAHSSFVTTITPCPPLPHALWHVDCVSAGLYGPFPVQSTISVTHKGTDFICSVRADVTRCVGICMCLCEGMSVCYDRVTMSFVQIEEPVRFLGCWLFLSFHWMLVRLYVVRICGCWQPTAHYWCPCNLILCQRVRGISKHWFNMAIILTNSFSFNVPYFFFSIFFLLLQMVFMCFFMISLCKLLAVHSYQEISECVRFRLACGEAVGSGTVSTKFQWLKIQFCNKKNPFEIISWSGLCATCFVFCVNWKICWFTCKYRLLRRLLYFSPSMGENNLKRALMIHCCYSDQP